MVAAWELDSVGFGGIASFVVEFGVRESEMLTEELLRIVLHVHEECDVFEVFTANLVRETDGTTCIVGATTTCIPNCILCDEFILKGNVLI